MPASQLEDDDLRQAFAEAWASGTTKGDLARTFGISRPTVNKWLADPRVEAASKEAILDRVTRMLRVIDGELERRINGPLLQKMPLDEILKIRDRIDKSGTIEDRNGSGAGGVNVQIDMGEIWRIFDKDPEKLEQADAVLTLAEGDVEDE
jgi:DNA-binding transcriptional regulator LsrR (DeoR family)